MTTQGHTSPERRQRTDARRNRARLVAAARETFAEAGPEASLNEIARRAGVGPGTLYRHFPTRPALLAAVLGERVDTLCEHAEELLTARPADEALTEWLRAFLRHARLNHGLAGTAVTGGPEALDDDCHRLILGAATQLLTRAQCDGTARAGLAAADLLHLVVGIALATARTRDPHQPDRLLALVLAAVFTGGQGEVGA